MKNLHRNVPFYSNTPDNFHCFQAALRMVLGYFIPDKEYTWDDLDYVTGHTSDYTWPMVGLIYCVRLGLSVHAIEPFDYERFAREGYDYLLEELGEEVADAQKRHSDLKQEMKNAGDFIKIVNLERRIPTETDIVKPLAGGALVMCNINARVIQEREGYSGHFVVVTGVDAEGLQIHDPGLPPLQDRFCSWSLFDKAWSYPNIQARNAMIIDERR
jgi:hypothetical protein